MTDTAVAGDKAAMTTDKAMDPDQREAGREDGLVERLRGNAPAHGMSLTTLHEEAADRIAALTAERDAFKRQVEAMGLIETVEFDDEDNSISEWRNLRAEAAEAARDRLAGLVQFLTESLSPFTFHAHPRSFRHDDKTAMSEVLVCDRDIKRARDAYSLAIANGFKPWTETSDGE